MKTTTKKRLAGAALVLFVLLYPFSVTVAPEWTVRVLDENGAPIGHYRLGGLARLNENHRKVFEALPEEFQWKHLADHFKGNGSKQVFIRACIAAKVLNPDKDGDCYRKLPGWKTA